MKVEKWRVIFYPLTIWLIFKFVAFLFGFTSAPDLAQGALLGGSSFPGLTALAIGLWIGAWSGRDFKLEGTLLNAFLVSFTVGFVELLLTIILINNSPTFVTYVTSLYSANSTVSAPIINLTISTWVGGMFTAISAAAAGYVFVSTRRRR